MSSDGDEGAIIERHLRDLLAAWEATGERWRDGARSEFETEHLEAIAWRTRHALKAYAELAALCAEAERSCA